MIVSKRWVPWYDERFTGYLEDKVVHIQTMLHMGFQFAVHPEAFVVHYPHADSKDQTLVKSTGLMQGVSALSHAHTAQTLCQSNLICILCRACCQQRSIYVRENLSLGTSCIMTIAGISILICSLRLPSHHAVCNLALPDRNHVSDTTNGRRGACRNGCRHVSAAD